MRLLSRRSWSRGALAAVGTLLSGTAGVASAGIQADSRPRALRWSHVDVFTDRPLTGNQLAVFLDAHGLDPDTMQLLAREIKFSESTFVFPPENNETFARLRIFTLDRELPFAGHPVIGATFALAEDRRIAPGRSEVVFGLAGGPTTVRLEWKGTRLAFAWMRQQLPEFGPTLSTRDAVARALGVPSSVLQSELPIQQVSCGLPYLLVPMHDRAAVDAAVFDVRAMRTVFEQSHLEPRSVVVFAPELSADADVYCRRFGFAVLEDPGTGAAAGALGCYLLRHDLITNERPRHMVVLQGVKMSRPSRLHVRIQGDANGITGVEVGGTSVVVGEGQLRF